MGANGDEGYEERAWGIRVWDLELKGIKGWRYGNGIEDMGIWDEDGCLENMKMGLCGY